MTDDAKARLAAILMRDKEMRKEKNKEAQDRETAMASLAKAWSEKIESVLRPGLNDVAKMLDEAGWLFEFKPEPRGFRISIYRGDMRAYGNRERPYLSFALQKNHNMVVMSEGLPNSINPTAADFPVENLDVEALTNLVAIFVEELAMK